MNLKLVVGVWICALALIGFFIWFGASDYLLMARDRYGDHSFLDENPRRPFFRAIFSSVMGVFTFVVAVMATARSTSRK